MAESAAEAVVANDSTSRARARRRWKLGVHAFTAAAHVTLGLALTQVVSPPRAATIAAIAWGATLTRLYAIAIDRKRALWVTRLVDEPLFAHWAAGVFGLLLLPLVGGVAWALGHSIGLAAAIAYGFGWILAAWGVWGCRRFVESTPVEVTLPGLHPDLAGYRIAHLTDLHVGSYDRRARALQWVSQANAARPDLAVVTGDLVTSGVDFYDDVAVALARLEARDGVYVALGNHDQWDSRALVAALEGRGLRVLENASVTLTRGRGTLVVAGLGDTYTGTDDLDATLAGRRDRVPTILLSHYPRFFAEAARRGVGLVLSGHTHGGQVGLPFFARHINPVALAGEIAHGLHRIGDSHLYVSAGLGTTGPPLRVGIRPEIPIIVLRAKTDAAQMPSAVGVAG